MLNRFSEWVKNFSDGAKVVPTQDDDFVATITACSWRQQWLMMSSELI